MSAVFSPNACSYVKSLPAELGYRQCGLSGNPEYLSRYPDGSIGLRHFTTLVAREWPEPTIEAAYTYRYSCQTKIEAFDGTVGVEVSISTPTSTTCTNDYSMWTAAIAKMAVEAGARVRAGS
jgi:hypothetical protein